jgi:hypothetical protein
MAERLGTQLQSGGLEQSINSGLIGSGLFGGASLDLNFAATKNLGPLVTFTRASSATYVGSDGLIKTATTNEPRFDHNPTTGESLGLMVEEARTNLLVRSEEFDNASWNSSAGSRTITANSIAAPDGSTTADTITADGTSNPHFASQAVTLSAVSYSFSVFAKAGTETLLGLRAFAAFGGAFVIFNLSTGTITSSANGGSGIITPYPNGWYRCTMVFTPLAASSSLGIYLRDTVNNTANTNLYLWGAQLEAGAFPTSYIPTTTAAATRSADVASITGSAFSSWYRQDEGTMFARYSFPQSPNTGGARVFVFINSAATNIIWLRAQGGVNRVYDVTDASVSQATFNQGAYAAGVEYRAALATKANDFGFAENGGAPQSDSSGTMPSAASAETDSLLLEDSPFNDFYILSYGEASSSGVGVDRLGIGVDVSGTAPGNVHIRRLTFFPQRLPNSTLVALTQ